MNPTRAVLLVVLAVAGGAVAADQLGLFNRGVSNVGTSPRDAYTGARAEAERRERILQGAAEVDAALADAEESWNEIRDSSIGAQTRALAQSQFRDRILQALRASGVDSPVVNERTPSSRFDDADRVQPISLTVRFDADTPRDAYNAVRVIESLPALWIDVERAQFTTRTISGESTDVAVETILNAIAIVEGGAS